MGRRKKKIGASPTMSETQLGKKRKKKRSAETTWSPDNGNTFG